MTEGEVERRSYGVFVVVLAVLAGTPSVAGAAGWVVQSVPTPPTFNGRSLAVSCPVATACESAGWFISTAGAQRPLVEGWSGTGWKAQSAPEPAGATSGFLDGVSCTAANACTAVGGYTDSNPAYIPMTLPLAERWNGTSWTVQPVPVPSGASSVVLNGVSCASASLCVAVGSYSTNHTQQHVTLAEVWNGTGWKIQGTTNPSTSENSLNGVSCAAANACVAVGGYQTSGFAPNRTLVERLSGSSWTVQSSQTPAGANTALLYGVSCSTASACTAVGGWGTSSGSTTQTLAERMVGSSWTIQATPTPSGTFVSGSSVSCRAARACTAAWAGGAPLVEGWNGASWTRQTTPSPAGLAGSLTGVSCASATVCGSVGFATNTSGGLIQTLAEHQAGGSWTIQSSPTPPASSSGFLHGVACTAAVACTAVGDFISSSAQQVSLAVIWNGTNWTAARTPNPAGAANIALHGVSCTAANACTAVGDYLNSAGHSQSLVEREGGTTWAIQSAPAPTGATDIYLTGVACAAANACTAVGSYSSGTAQRFPLAEAWNGTSWTIQSTPLPAGAASTSLKGVSCRGASACVAVGEYTNGASQQLTLAEIRNGTSWTLRTTPSLSSPSSLNATSCTAGNACTAVGGSGTKPLAERWNGTSWTVQNIPAPLQTAGVTGVSCTVATACTAVGDNSFAFYAETWNGTSWTAQTPAYPPGAGLIAQDRLLDGVACTAASACTAAGEFDYQYVGQNDYLDRGSFTGMWVPLAERHS
jgi:hypothetical protein